ncbi:hypothetical protein C2E23DRAFT_718089 [Lenzites betulinus]|nr:hypothetical protein C2E23DRAFT_718089 [Lenzites betulinus]
MLRSLRCSQANVQSHARTLLRRPHGKSKFHASTVATARQVRGFDPAEGRCCDVATFCLDFTSTPGSIWNKSAAAVFVDDFLAVRLFTCKNRKEITEMFNRHFRTLQKHLKLYGVLAAAGPSESHKEHSRETRRYTVCLTFRRYNIALRYGGTRRHVPLLQRLGPEGMSSDEEDTEGPFTRYAAFRKPWRHASVTRIMRILDALHRRSRSRSGQGSQRGRGPRVRYMSSQVSPEKRVVRRLPRNAYDPDWLRTRTAVQLEELDIEETPYDFTIDPVIVA